MSKPFLPYAFAVSQAGILRAHRSAAGVSLLLLAALCSSASILHAQSAEEVQARRLASDGRRQADSGRYDRAVELLNEARKLVPAAPEYGYELARVYAMKREYRRTVEILTDMLKRPRGATDRWYQLLGNSYDSLRDRKKAKLTYTIGLKAFPNSGLLCEELGLMMLAAKDTMKALGYWENGIRNDPMFASNYYRAAKLSCAASRRLWGILYGEIFMNLEPATARSKEMGAMLFQAYRASYFFSDSLHVSFMPPPSASGKGRKKSVGPKVSGVPTVVPFTAVHNVVSVKFVEGEDGAMRVDTAITLARLSEIRSAFIDEWYQRGLEKNYRNVLFAWQKGLFDAGHSEAYTYWMLGHGAPEEFRAWRQKNNARLDAFIRAIAEHPIRIDKDNVFVRYSDW